MKKGTYIDYQILLACLSKPPVQVKKVTSFEEAGKPGKNVSQSSEVKRNETFQNKEAA